MIQCDCLIIGSGPAGLGAAFSLLEQKPQLKIILLESLPISCGGLRNDCKMNFTFPVGFPLEYWTKQSAKPYLERIENFLNPHILQKDNLEKYTRRSEKIGVQLLNIRQSHLGTDGGIRLIKELTSKLTKMGVELSFGEALLSANEKAHRAITDKREIQYKHLIVAPGRHGFDFLRKFMEHLDIAYKDNSIDVGIRLETKKEHYPIVEDYYDPKFLFPERTRTFCTNSGSAHVVQEKYTSSKGETYYSVNGHAFSNAKEPNGLVNFAVLRSVSFTEPIASGQDYAEYLGALAMHTGGGNPIMQRIGDFRMRIRSTRESLNQDLYDFEPT
ncbi:MAG TPA: FAD-dependent oxidoreductase, partial [Treponemataceae bacterium]|nr:FAD-dependent oxidoreductase [Treponemataceae bacterium]HPM05465.1 FAD-dependent oxidoreductase [Treponemataceae bacterium]